MQELDILLQAPQALRIRLPEALGQLPQGACQAAIAPILLVSIATQNWRDYLNHLENEIYTLESKSLLVKVVKNFPEDWEISFCDTQALQRLRRRLLKAQGALISTHRILNVHLKEHILELERNAAFNDEPLREVILELENLISRVVARCDAATRMLQKCEGISKVAFDFLAHCSSNSMEKLSASTRQECVRTYQVSNSVKVLTLISVLYLPAGLIATLFSSSLISTSKKNQAAHFVLSDQFWIYPILTIGVTLVKFAPILVWQYFDKLPCRKVRDPENSGLDEKTC